MNSYVNGVGGKGRVHKQNERLHVHKAHIHLCGVIKIENELHFLGDYTPSVS